jgi:hypothetical protein
MLAKDSHCNLDRTLQPERYLKEKKLEWPPWLDEPSSHSCHKLARKIVEYLKYIFKVN